MKKSDKQITEMLGKELDNCAQAAKIPLRLQKDSVVAMLKEAEKTQTDFSVETGTNKNIKAKNGNVVMLRRLTATAAMLALVIAGVLLMRTDSGVKIVKTDYFYKGYKGSLPVVNAESYEDVEKAVEEILEEKAEIKSTEKTTEEAKKPAKTDDNAKQSTEKIKNSLIEGYGEYVAIASGIVDGIIDAAEKSYDANEPGGVATYGDFKADIIKTDGRYLYLASTGISSETGAAIEQIKIVKASSDGEIEAVSDIVLSSSESNEKYDECIEIYLKNGCLTAIMKRHEHSVENSVFTDNPSTVALSYDISDPYAPKKIREHIQDGEYVSSNLYENRLCIVTAKTITDNAEENELIPVFSVDGEEKKLRAEEIFIAVNDPEASYLFVTVTDIADFSKETGCLAVLGCGNEIYCSSSAIAVAREFVSLETDESNNRKSFTEIYRFNINDTNIALSGSYVVQGSLIGGISVDEDSGNFRAITTDSFASYVYVLDKEMDFVSGLKGIFPGEKISSVKFIGSNGYVIVDGETDKTMIIDFSAPSMPKVAGTIEGKAFSDALYAVSESLVLGMSEDENGIITLTLFDVSDASNPVTTAVYTLDSDCRSVSASDSRSIMLAAEEKILGIPVLKSDRENGTEISAYIIFDVSDGKIRLLGTCNHDLSYIGDAAVRGAFIEDILYTVSGEKIVSFDIISEAKKQMEFSLN